ncbi:hypothetical protein [Myxococcus phage Mx1]|nr:hypothetical protein [Myxococcus phage Mx1]
MAIGFAFVEAATTKCVRYSTQEVTRCVDEGESFCRKYVTTTEPVCVERVPK